MPTKEKSTKKATEPSPKPECVVIGVGASAGGLEALQELISHLPINLPDIAIVVTQHLSPTYKSMLVQLLSRQTNLEVVEIKNRGHVVAGKIYITPPDAEVTITNGVFHLQKPVVSSGPKPSVDAFFRSLASDKGSKCVGVILSGTGTDGADGIKAIKKAGGLTIAQEPQTAKYDGMPIAAIESGYVDLVLSPDKIGDELMELMQWTATEQKIKPDDKNDASSLDTLLKMLSKQTGTDFANYKPSTICRRLEKRLSELDIDGVEKYIEFIHNNPKELDTLFNNILIGVTTFFRDPDAFKDLEKQIIRIFASKVKGDTVRIWIPGCATGEEAYTIAICIARLINHRFQDYNIQIFATDIDERAITKARKAEYSKRSLENVPDDILQTYFLRNGNSYEVIKSIRQLILFSKHDVTSNPPFLKLDLISCRNLLIYFGQSLQKHVIPIFHYALNPEAILFLGKSETVGQFTDLFSTLEGKSKIFQRKRGNYLHSIKFSSFKPNRSITSSPISSQHLSVSRPMPESLSIPEMVKETLYNTFEYSYVVINDVMDVLEINGDVRMFLSLNPGSLNANILKMADTKLKIELRSVITKAIREKQSVKSEIKKIMFFSNAYFVRIAVKPLLYSEPENGLYAVIFEQHEPTPAFLHELKEGEPDKENLKVIELEHELASTKEHLQTFVEELETANEELQSLNEELQSSNEELQSSNEELETSNEELQSTNEELQIAYAELKTASEEVEKQARALAISEANSKALLNNQLQAFFLIGKDYRIIDFNKTASKYIQKIFDRPLEINLSIIDYQIPGELESFQKDFKKALAGKVVYGVSEVVLESGEKLWFRYNFTPLIDSTGINAISYSRLDITQQKRIEQELAENEELINSIFNAADIGICVTNQERRFVKVNQTYCDLYGYSLEEVIGNEFTMMLDEGSKELAQQLHDRFLEGQPETPGTWEVKRKNGELISVRVTASRLMGHDGRKFKVTTVARIHEPDHFVNRQK